MAAPCSRTKRAGVCDACRGGGHGPRYFVSVFPLAMYQALQDALIVSKVYFAVGLASLLTGLMVPYLTRFIARRWVYSAGAGLFVIGALLAIQGSPAAIVTALLLITI